MGKINDLRFSMQKIVNDQIQEEDELKSELFTAAKLNSLFYKKYDGEIVLFLKISNVTSTVGSYSRDERGLKKHFGSVCRSSKEYLCRDIDTTLLHSSLMENKREKEGFNISLDELIKHGAKEIKEDA